VILVLFKTEIQLYQGVIASNVMIFIPSFTKMAKLAYIILTSLNRGRTQRFRWLMFRNKEPYSIRGTNWPVYKYGWYLLWRRAGNSHHQCALLCRKQTFQNVIL